MEKRQYVLEAMAGNLVWSNDQIDMNVICTAWVMMHVDLEQFYFTYMPFFHTAFFANIAFIVPDYWWIDTQRTERLWRKYDWAKNRYVVLTTTRRAGDFDGLRGVSDMISNFFIGFVAPNSVTNLLGMKMATNRPSRSIDIVFDRRLTQAARTAQSTGSFDYPPPGS